MEIIYKKCYDYHEGENMERLDLYRCNICGNIVEVIFAGKGELTCCGQPMEKLEAQTSEDAIMEKHVPIFIEFDDNTKEVRVGEVLHPMLPEHHIMFIETISKDKNQTKLKFLTPDDEPKMLLNNAPDDITAREYCNIHGLWKSK